MTATDTPHGLLAALAVRGTISTAGATDRERSEQSVPASAPAPALIANRSGILLVIAGMLLVAHALAKGGRRALADH
ncbi:MAG: hypothetical protein GY715_13135 [Planctomycetes bacterium]|nr:hypothetical protein [Planctomycetota bacterium]